MVDDNERLRATGVLEPEAEFRNCASRSFERISSIRPSGSIARGWWTIKMRKDIVKVHIQMNIETSFNSRTVGDVPAQQGRELRAKSG